MPNLVSSLEAIPTILLTGADSQLAKALVRTFSAYCRMFQGHAPLEHSARIYALSHVQLDIGNELSIAAAFAQYKPDWVINCAAYNAVDRAEIDADNAYRVNALGAERLAKQCALTGARLVHISSDYVFSDQFVGAERHALTETATPSPLSCYGKSKLAGELAVQEILGDRAIVIRTSWLYGVDGHNFVKTMLKLMANATESSPALTVINDQIGSPTWVDALAHLIWQLMFSGASGLYHYAGQGQCSWYEFALEIQRQALALKLLDKYVPISAIDSVSYNLRARAKGNVLAPRPSYSPLNSDKARQRLADNVPQHSQVSQMFNAPQIRQRNLTSSFDPVLWQDWSIQLRMMLQNLSAESPPFDNC